MEPSPQPDITRITPSEAERTSGVLASETIEKASRSFRADGALMLEDIVDRQVIADCRKAFEGTYSHYLDGERHEDALKVGERRVLITLRMEPPFDSQQLFANPYLLPVMKAVLDDGFIVGAFGIVCSLPSAPVQHLHDDGGTLFPQSGLNGLLPAAAITVAIPLVAMNDIIGTTALWPGSHRDSASALKLPAVAPDVSEGSCMVWDFRLKHQGTANKSLNPRPLLYMTYCRPWFVEYRNFTEKSNPKQRPLLATEAFLSALPKEHRRLFARAQMC